MIKIKTSLVHARMDALMLTTAELAEIIGVSTTTLCRILANRTCKPTVAGRLAHVLGINVWELIA